MSLHAYWSLPQSYLSEKAPETFLRPEMVDRIAVMLNYYVIELASQKCQEIQVKSQLARCKASF